MKRPLSAAVLTLAVIAIGSSSRGQEPDATQKAMDAKISQSVFKTIDSGYKLYNGRDPVGCYRVYQGALTALSPLLDYRADLKSTVDAALAKAEAAPDVATKAFTLRTSLDTVLAATSPPKSLWTRLGGEPAVTAVVNDFVNLTAGNPKVDFTRGGRYKLDAAGVANIKKQLVDLISATTGGPRKYTGGDMKEVHKGMGITEAQFGAIAGDLIATLDKYKVPKKEKDELIAIVASTKGAIVEAPSGEAPPPPPTPPTTEKPLWDRLGGEPAVTAVINDFVDLAAGDPKVDFLRDGKYKIDAAGVANLKKQLVDLVSATTGGPRKYTGGDMKKVHMGMGINEAQFGAIAADLVEVLDKYKVPEKEKGELFKIVGSTKDAIVEAK
jgi:truncated hemoglobin YjbI